MKVLSLAVFLFCSTFAHAYELDLSKAQPAVPAELVELLKQKIDQKCGSVNNRVIAYKAESVQYSKNRIDQGYYTEYWTVVFEMIYKDFTPEEADLLKVEMMKDSDDRMGQYQYTIEKFETTYGSDGDSICN